MSFVKHLVKPPIICMLQYDDQIRSSMYQIVCRSYYPNENKNSLDLLDLLTDLQLGYNTTQS